MQPGEDLVEKVEQGSDILIVLLSKASWPVRLPRERWDPILVDAPDSFVLLEDCPYPELLRRKPHFIDARIRNAGRELKRRIWRQQTQAGTARPEHWSSDLEELYATIADHPGSVTIDGATARRFAAEAAHDFEAVLWVPCHDRTTAQCVGELGAQLGAILDGQLDQNRERISEILSFRRLLLVLDAPDEQALGALRCQPGRTSILITSNPVEIQKTPATLDYAFQLVSKRRFVEAYDLLTSLAEELETPGPCTRELAWICDHWGLDAEAAYWRSRCDLMPTLQLPLFD